MSYCRFSSDNFACDVYVYEHCYGGWTTHVAGRRVVGNVPKLPPLTADNKDAFFAAYRAQMDFMETAQHADIGLPHDGAQFSDNTPGACAERLESLRTIGYNVPQHAIDQLREESNQPL